MSRSVLALSLLSVSCGGSNLPRAHPSPSTEHLPPAEDGACASGQLPPMPHVVSGGELLSAADSPISETHTIDGRAIHLRPLHSELQLTYIHNILAPEELERLVQLATERNGWARSPLKSQGSGERLSKDDRRNSSSCPLLWPIVYADKREMLKARNPALVEELELVERLTARVAGLFTATGMELTSNFIEPLQLVRYRASEHFGPHHDYHELNSEGQLGSAVQGEQRAFTVLLFGTTLPPGAGGETHFCELDVAVSPTLGDAVVWANIGADGEPDPRSLHQGMPPKDGHEKVAINLWISDQEFDPAAGALDGAVRSG